MQFARLVLLNTLKKELRYEQSISKAPAYLSEFIRKHNLLEQTTKNSQYIKVYKQVLTYKVQIEFPFRPPVPIRSERKYADEESDDEESDVDDPISSMFKQDVSKFFLSIQTGQDQFVHFECFTYESAIWFQNIVCTEKLPEYVASLFRNTEVQVNYNILNENLQQCLVHWVKALEISEEFGKFIELRSLFKEKELYLAWLQNITRVIEGEKE